jgi:hypothetical protein
MANTRKLAAAIVNVVEVIKRKGLTAFVPHRNVDSEMALVSVVAQPWAKHRRDGVCLPASIGGANRTASREFFS